MDSRELQVSIGFWNWFYYWCINNDVKKRKYIMTEKKEYINLSEKQYNTQRDNLKNPNAACMPTSYSVFLEGNNIPFENRSLIEFGKQYANDDYFMMLLNTKEAKDYCYRNYPFAYNATHPDWSLPPNQIHGMYSSYLAPLICGEKVSSFMTTLTFESYVDYVVRLGKVIMTSGSFPEAKIDGHAFCVIGYSEVTNNLILSDPYGNFMTNYKDPYGYHIEMSREEFIAHVKPCKELKKWGHVPIV
jgi:hypothetical protein